ncbi:hypothetical protein ACFQ9X_12740 [Catenulispora yoronensis]
MVGQCGDEARGLPRVEPVGGEHGDLAGARVAREQVVLTERGEVRPSFA